MTSNPALTEEVIHRYLLLAYRLASKISPDPSTQNGAVVLDWDCGILSWGVNTFTDGIKSSPEKLQRPLKYSYVEHAERYALYKLLSYRGKHSSSAPYVMVCPWAACTECARAIVASGVKILVRHQEASDRSPERWIESIKFADELLIAGGVEIVNYSHKKLGAPTIMHCEEEWTP